MHNYITFLRKESMEMLRTKRLLGVLCVFVFFALSSPLLARYMVEFIAALVPQEEGLAFLIPDPVWTDSYMQFYGNIAQIGVIALIVLFMGAIVSERQRGTTDLVITKGLSQMNFVLSKFSVISVTLLFTMLVSILLAYLYTFALFDEVGTMGNALLGALVYSLFLLLIVALILLCSALARSSAVAALLSFVGFLVILFISSLPVVGRLFPGNLHERSMEITTAGYFHGDLLGNVLLSLALTALFLLLAVLVLKRREGE